MKVEGYLFIGCAVFFAAADIVYWYYSKDPTGTTALALAVGLAFLSAHSWWPLFTGLACATAAIGAAVGWWLFLIGMLFVVLSSIGFVFEYYRGVYAH